MSTPEVAMQCPRCGTPFLPGVPRCNSCGLVVALPPHPAYAWRRPPLQAEPPRRSAVAAIVGTVIAVLLLVGGIVTALLLWPEQGKDSLTEGTVEPAVASSPFPDFASVYADVHDGVGQVLVATCSDGGFAGSAFLVSPSLMATAAHVINGASALQVSVGGELVDAEIFGVDLSHDLALLQLGEEVDGHVFAFSPQDPEPGTRIAAIGYPLGEPETLTEGTVSGLDRSIDTAGGRYEGMLQTDTAINPGSSGGPLLDINGRVVGVADAIRTDAQGIGFAVPATIASGITASPLQTQQLLNCP